MEKASTLAMRPEKDNKPLQDAVVCFTGSSQYQNFHRVRYVHRLVEGLRTDFHT